MGRGEVLFEYTPLPMSPMTVALLLLLGVVTIGGAAAFPRDFGPLILLWFVPLAAVAVWAFVQRPSRTRVYADGIEISLPRWRRWLRRDAYVPWTDVRNVYPATYEVAGAAMSPFASSAGTLVHTGLGLDLRDGRRITVKFTPGAIRAFRSETPGFRYAMEAVRRAFAALGRPLVTDVRPYTDEEIRAMHAEAREPLLGLGAIVYAFFLPPAIVAVGLLFLGAAGIPADAAAILALLALAAIPPFASMSYTLGRSRRRNYLLGELAKYEESVRAHG